MENMHFSLFENAYVQSRPLEEKVSDTYVQKYFFNYLAKIVWESYSEVLLWITFQKKNFFQVS